MEDIDETDDESTCNEVKMDFENVKTENNVKTEGESSLSEGIKYFCDQCDYTGNSRKKLTQHKKSVHEGVKYYCDHPVSLQNHKRSKHEGVRYYCDQCEYVTSYP